MNKPIRILQVVTYMGRGGLETMLMNYYRHIDRNEVQFDFLVHRDFRAAYDDEIEALGGRIYHLPRLVPWSYTYKKALDDFFKVHSEYRIVHVHQDCLSSVILKIATQNNIPVRIAHSHNSAQDKNIKYLIKLYYKKMIPQYATDLFACGDDAGKWMFEGKSFEVLNNAIHAVSYRYNGETASAMRRTLGIPQDAFVIGHVGRFSLQKNHEFLVRVFSSVYEKEKNAYLLLIGNGVLRPKIEEKVKISGLENHVIFMGVRSDVPELLQAMDVFVFPSLYEGLGIAAIEAQAAGLPCVLSDRVPLAACITGETQRISLNNSPSFWAERILRQNRERMDTYQVIADAGFDIIENAKHLQNFYLEHWKANV